jgi:CHAT domain-containing protein
MEFALRSRGASTVIASHWNVTWWAASRFFLALFRYWLDEGMPRAQAWRRAILDQADPTSSPDSGLPGACAFSLFGDWR